jgi:putative N6-adenine-specific DNA methylase
MEKRVKRRVTARNHDFFCICPPGLRNLCRKELSGLDIDPSGIQVKKGGVEFIGKVQDCYRANLYLRSPVRILMRVCSFRAESFAELEKKAASVDWELYVPSNATVEYSVSCSKSRLYHTGAVEERLAGIVSKKAETDGIPSADSEAGPLIRLFVRGENDRFEISVDSSGELLFKRGIKEMAGRGKISPLPFCSGPDFRRTTSWPIPCAGPVPFPLRRPCSKNGFLRDTSAVSRLKTGPVSGRHSSPI